LEEPLDLPDAPEGFFCTFAMARMLTKAMAYVNGRRGVVLVGCGKFAQPVEGGESGEYCLQGGESATKQPHIYSHSGPNLYESAEFDSLYRPGARLENKVPRMAASPWN